MKETQSPLDSTQTECVLEQMFFMALQFIQTLCEYLSMDLVICSTTSMTTFYCHYRSSMKQQRLGSWMTWRLVKIFFFPEESLTTYHDAILQTLSSCVSRLISTGLQNRTAHRKKNRTPTCLMRRKRRRNALRGRSRGNERGVSERPPLLRLSAKMENTNIAGATLRPYSLIYAVRKQILIH